MRAVRRPRRDGFVVDAASTDAMYRTIGHVRGYLIASRASTAGERPRSGGGRSRRMAAAAFPDRSRRRDGVGQRSRCARTSPASGSCGEDRWPATAHRHVRYESLSIGLSDTRHVLSELLVLLLGLSPTTSE